MPLPFSTPILPGPAGASLAKFTDKGMELLARSVYQDLAFKITHFAVGTGGFTPTDPRQADPIDTTDTALLAEIFRGIVDSFDEPTYIYNPNSGYVIDPPGIGTRYGTDAVLVNATNRIQSASASFVSGDVGKRFALTTGSQSGTYVIKSVNSATEISVVNVTGQSVSFTTATGVSWQILVPDTSLVVHRSSVTSPPFSADAVTVPGRTGADGVTVAPATFTSATATFTAADTGRLLIILEGYNAGVWKMTHVNATTVTLSMLNGGTVNLSPEVTLDWRIPPTIQSATATFDISDFNRRFQLPAGANLGLYYIYFVNSASEITVMKIGSTGMEWPTLTPEISLAWDVIQSSDILAAVALSQPLPTGLAIGCRLMPGSGVSNVIGELGLFATVMYAPDYFTRNDGSTVAAGNTMRMLATTITVVAGSGIVEGETFTIYDGVNEATIFEFDSDALVQPGHVAVTYAAGSTAIQVRDSMIASITGVGGTLNVSTVVRGDAVVQLTHDAGTGGIIVVTDTVQNSGFIVRNMPGPEFHDGLIGWTVAVKNGADLDTYKIASVSTATDYTTATVTTTGGGAVTFIGSSDVMFEFIRRGYDGATSAGDDKLSSATARFMPVDEGRLLKILSGGNAGTYIIKDRISSTQVQLMNVDGSPVSFAAFTGQTWQIPDTLPGDLYLAALVHFPVLTVFDNEMQLHRPTVVL